MEHSIDDRPVPTNSLARHQANNSVASQMKAAPKAGGAQMRV